jgi:hypothetical protein
MVAHDSFFGFMNLFDSRNRHYVNKAGERPPFPIISSDPSFREIVNNLNRADFGFFCSVYALGSPR